MLNSQVSFSACPHHQGAEDPWLILMSHVCSSVVSLDVLFDMTCVNYWYPSSSQGDTAIVFEVFG